MNFNNASINNYEIINYAFILFLKFSTKYGFHFFSFRDQPQVKSTWHL